VTDQSLYLHYVDWSGDKPVAQWAGDLDGSGLGAAVVGFGNNGMGPLGGWVVDVGGDRRTESLFLLEGEGVLLNSGMAVPDATGDGVVDFISGMDLCDGAKVADGAGNESCGVPIPGIGESAADVDGDGVTEIVIRQLGMYSVTTDTLFPPPAQGMGSPTFHQTDLTGDGADDLFTFGENGVAPDFGELRVYDGPILVAEK
jgi:hypothetical protein